MPRKGHKEGCQCIVCKTLRTKELRERTEGEIPQTPVRIKGVTLGSLKIGESFRYGIAPTKVYKKLSEANSIIGGSEHRDTMILDLQDDEAKHMNAETTVEPMPLGHEVEKEE